MTRFLFDDAKSYSPLVLAFIGDGVQNLYVRSRLVSEKKDKVHYLHKRASDFLRASGQRLAIDSIMEHLTEGEQTIYKRGRNAKSQTVPKNADVTDYRHATGFEALLGYLYIKGEEERLNLILDMAFDIVLKK